MSPSSYADVVLPVPLHQAFTYLVPEGMAAAAGVRVWAPWGTRKLIGVVTALRPEPPPGVKASQIKALSGVVDAEPLLDAAMLELVRWAAAYYQAPVGELMRAALPPGPLRGDGAAPAPRTRRVYRLVAQVPLTDEARLTPAQRQLIAVLEAAGGEADAAWLRPRASASALQTLVRRGRLAIEERATPLSLPAWQPRARIATLNSSQALVLAAIEGVGDNPAGDGDAATNSKPVLLHGVTGSGKTAVYIAAIEAALARGEAALMLVPEIGLTPALFADFEDAFPGLVAVLHSGLSNAERTAFWHRLHQGAARVAIGTRSAVFAPLPRLGLIVVDEEHDASYKQQESPRYHGRDLAIVRARLAGARILLGSATPSLESATHARSGKYRLAEMRDRVQHRPLPAVRLVDMSAEFRRRAAAPKPPASTPDLIYSEDLAAAIADRLARRQQAMVLINRRGFAPVVLCRSCGSTVMCRDCSLSLTFHRRVDRLVCHYCGYATEAPRTCPGCGSEHLYFLGSGSEKAEATLQEMFPHARIARLDRDTARTRRHFERVLAAFRAGEYDLLIGTQMIAKGHDLPGVTLVGVLQADLGLNFPDYRAAERTFQLLTQVAGRAGRGEHPGEVIVQVQHPEHYAVTAASQGDYAGFFEKEAQFRRWMHYPPFAALALVQIRHANYDRVLQLTTQAGEHLRAQLATAPGTRLLGPSPALVARAKTEYRFQFLFKSSSRRELGGLLASLRTFTQAHRFPATALVIDVDPLSL